MAYLLIKRMLRDPANRHRARLAESLMEQLALHSDRSDSSDQWAMMGLLAFVDVEYVAANPSIRGKIAQQNAVIDGLPKDLGELLDSVWQDDQRDPPALLDGLRLAIWLAERADDTPDIAKTLAFYCDSGDSKGALLDAALERLGLSTVEAEQLVGQATLLVGARP